MKLVRYAVVGVAIFSIVALFAAVSFADCGVCGIGEASKAIVEKSGEFVGKVVNVTVAEPAKGIADGSVTVVDEVGKTAKFTVKGTAKIVAYTMDALTLNQLKIGDKVGVTEKGGEAQTIKVVK
ncbi:MAG: hypothetical protein KKH77_07770 [Candidatus Omnitrophica bacterium]|nr:hypothetical protein [Candidatus Omnitrophota bacterium]MBU0881793.1 hypothetical protein [Candidatus Omnitrophota bacterium]MBU1808786.1 hypothetical protein [Candidatus Omnitrophota bacterium]